MPEAGDYQVGRWGHFHGSLSWHTQLHHAAAAVSQVRRAGHKCGVGACDVMGCPVDMLGALVPAWHQAEAMPD